MPAKCWHYGRDAICFKHPAFNLNFPCRRVRLRHINGVLVRCFALPAIVVTIGTVSRYRGLAIVVLGDQAFTGYPALMVEWGQGYFSG